MTTRRLPRTLAAVMAAGLVLAACGGATGDEPAEPTNDATAANEAATAGGDGEQATEEGSGDLPLVYGVFATPLEEPWDGAIHQALTAAADDGLIEYRHTDNNDSVDKMTRTLNDVITNQQPDIIFGDAFSAEDAIREVAVEFPDTQFAFGSGGESVDPNFSVFDNWLQDPAYLSGMLAGGITESDTIGVVGAMPIPEVNRIVNAFIAGVGETNEDATVKVTFINSFFDPATAKQAALAQVDQGADVLFAEREGVIEAAVEADLPAFGMMVDQHEDAPDHVVTSLVWNMRPTVDHVLDEFNAGNMLADNLGEFSFMVNGGSSLPEINTDVPGGVPDDLVTQVNDVKQEILDGGFEVPIDEEAPAGSTTVGQ